MLNINGYWLVRGIIGKKILRFLGDCWLLLVFIFVIFEGKVKVDRFWFFEVG